MHAYERYRYGLYIYGHPAILNMKRFNMA